MSNNYFHVKHLVTGQDHVIQAPRASSALAVVAGDRSAVKQATNDEIAEHFTAGLALHEKSVAEGDGKVFLAKGNPNVLIRAKNASAAFEAISEGSYKVEKCTQDQLVNLLTSGIMPQYFEDKARAADGTLPPAGEGQDLEAANDATAGASSNVVGEGGDGDVEAVAPTAHSADAGSGAEMAHAAADAPTGAEEASNEDAGEKSAAEAA